MNVIGYARLSRAGNGHGLDAQRRAIEEHCERQAWMLLGIETDEAASGRSTRKRPGLSRALEFCSSGAAQAIVSSRVDRLARSSLDFHRIVQEAQRSGFTLVFTEQPGFSLDSPEGKMLVSILASFAEFEADLISARTKAGLEAARRKGKKLGGPNLKPVPPDVLARIQALRAEGLSLAAIAARLEAEGVPTARGAAHWRKDVIHRILRAAERAK